MFTKKEDKISKEQQNVPHDGDQNESDTQSHPEGAHSILNIPGSGELSTVSCCGGLTYIILGAITIILAVIEILVSSLGAAILRYYDAPQSGRMLAMILLVVVAALTLGLVFYAIVGVRRKHTKPLHSTAIVLVVVALIQGLIAGLAVHISEYDEYTIGRFIAESFYLSKDGHSKEVQTWDSIQSHMQCCGLYSPEDYRDPNTPLIFPPDVPASCCPFYSDSGLKNNATRNKERELCKSTNSYYNTGCKIPIMQVVKGSSAGVLSVTILLIVAEVLVAILGGFLSRKRKLEKHQERFAEVSEPPTTRVETPVPPRTQSKTSGFK